MKHSRSPKSAAGKNGASRYNVPNLERGLQIIELLIEHPQGLPQSEIVSRLGLSKTSVFRITMTLLDYGYLERHDDTKMFTLSSKLLALGSRSFGEQDLLVASLDVMRQLRDMVKETVLLGALVGNEFAVLEQVLGSHPFKFSVDLGFRLPIHTVAPAKAVAAFLPQPERERLLDSIDFVRYTDRTITSRRAYEAELAAVKERGYATDRGEQLSGIHCIAAPVFNRHGYPIAGVWTTGPSDRLGEADFERVGKLVLTHARTISTKLGHGVLSRPSKAS